MSSVDVFGEMFVAIMTYDAWMRRTKRGLTKPRSKELRQLDNALKDYHLTRGDKLAFQALYGAAAAWQNSKDDAGQSVRNKDGAVTELFDSIVAESDRGKAEQAKAVHDISRMNRPAGFLAEVRGGAGKLAAGKLDGKFSNAGFAKIETDPAHKHISYEGFVGPDLAKAQRGWALALDGAARAARAMTAVQMGAATGLGAESPEYKRYVRWFGKAGRTELADMGNKMDLMLLAMRTRKITFVHRPVITNHYVDGDDPLGPMEDDPIGPGVYGYVWSAGNHTGNGMRIVCNKMFLGDACPYEGAAATIYHELTHKVLGTKDKSLAGVTTYGIRDCTRLAAADPASARNVADCWSHYAISFLKAI